MSNPKLVTCPKCGKLYFWSPNQGWCSCETKENKGDSNE